ncbi:MAG: family 10 glycosylhydrolase [Lentisphaerae bacterium]|nr:family 10 glycosylhydrolase [Lentisphaerota bacterium]MBT4823104.1 family 10 glycosylhydrolase [Lentisphaerota bacterium]MBT5607971.1 family 10 glycosylhydrolase [Lentisphaerota bacterium]MBT7057498.1 family 10 glycosylhydrolase [Lentisphaerota bacterium]MBT7845644.1 family 10 glycosylhydrolase [Lentisphaerota bacterium]
MKSKCESESRSPGHDRQRLTAMKRTSTFAAAIWWALTSFAWSTPLVDLSRPTPRHAAMAWVPSGAAAPAQPVQAGSTAAITFTCRFAASDAKRASWDVPARIDLRLARGIRLSFYSTDLTGAGSLFVYLRSGNGWYAMPFEPRGGGQWETIDLLKVRSRTEGQPLGWGQIDTIRLSAWRGQPRNTTFTIANISAIHPTVQAAIVRAVSARPQLSEGDARGIYTYAENVAFGLDSAGINPALLDDTDIAPGLLDALKLVILPYCPRLAPTAIAEISRFSRRGGHVIAFYDLPPPIQKTLGLRLGAYRQSATFRNGIRGFLPRADELRGAPPRVGQASWNVMTLKARAPNAVVGATWEDGQGRDTTVPALLLTPNAAWMSHVYLGQDTVAGSQFLAALVARALPQTWAGIARARLQRLTSGLPYTSFADACAKLRPRVATAPRAAGTLTQSINTYNKAVTEIQRGNAVNALPLLEKARHDLSATVCALEPAPLNEFRGVWCHRGHGVAGMTWEQSVSHLRNCGFNALLVNMASAGRASCRSTRLLPGEDGVDHLAACASACRRHGVQLHAWFVCLRIEPADRSALLKRGISLGAQQTTPEGKLLPQWLCPSDPRNRQHLVAITTEVAQRYPISGIHLDYIRYAGQQTCFCAGCRRRFEARIGQSVTNWPTSCTTSSTIRSKWLDFRRDTITSLVAEVRAGLQRTSRGVKLSAAVYPREATARDSVAQVWSEWRKRRLVDFVCPMSYADSTEAFGRLVQSAAPRQALSVVPVFPGIGVSSRKLDAIETLMQIRMSRRHQTGGFVLFEYNRQTAEDILPMLAQGATATR